MPRKHAFSIFVLLFVVGFVAFLGGKASAANSQSAKAYSGVEVQNLIDVVDDLSDEVLQLHNDLGTICGMLNSDSGVNYVNFAPTNSGSNTVQTLVRR